MGERDSLLKSRSGPTGAAADNDPVALNLAAFDRRDWLISAGLALAAAAGALPVQSEEQADTTDATQRAAPTVSQPIQDALSALEGFAERADITHYPVDNPERLVVVMTEAHLGDLTAEQLQIIGVDPKTAKQLDAKQRELLIDLAHALRVGDLYADSMTPDLAEDLNLQLRSLRIFRAYDRALRDPDLPQATREKLRELDQRYHIEENREFFEEFARQVAAKPALLAAYNLQLNLGGLEPQAELEAMQSALRENPRLKAEDPEMARLMLARDRSIIARLPQVSDAPVDLLFYGDGHFQEDTIRAMNEQGIYVVRLTENGVRDFLDNKE